MAYARYSEKITEYQSESFSKVIYKTSGEIWSTNEVGTYEFIDATGVVLDTGSMVKTDGNLGFGFNVSSTITEAIVGGHILLVTLADTGDATFNDVIAEYKIKYIVRSA